MIPTKINPFSKICVKIITLCGIPTRYFSSNSYTVIKYQKLIEESQGIAVIGFNSPQNKNALSSAFVQETSSALDQVYNDSTLRVLILRSCVPGIFCAGKYKQFFWSSHAVHIIYCLDMNI